MNKLIILANCPKCDDVVDMVKDNNLDVELVYAGSDEGISLSQRFRLVTYPALVMDDSVAVGNYEAIIELLRSYIDNKSENEGDKDGID